MILVNLHLPLQPGLVYFGSWSTGIGPLSLKIMALMNFSLQKRKIISLFILYIIKSCFSWSNKMIFVWTLYMRMPPVIVYTWKAIAEIFWHAFQETRPDLTCTQNKHKIRGLFSQYETVINKPLEHNSLTAMSLGFAVLGSFLGVAWFFASCPCVWCTFLPPPRGVCVQLIGAYWHEPICWGGSRPAERRGTATVMMLLENNLSHQVCAFGCVWLCVSLYVFRWCVYLLTGERRDKQKKNTESKEIDLKCQKEVDINGALCFSPSKWYYVQERWHMWSLSQI